MSKNLISGKTSPTGLDIYLAKADAICKIIKAASGTNIREIRAPELVISFGSSDQVTERPEAIQTKSFVQDSNEIEKSAAREEAVRHLEDDLDQLRLTDPLAYEKFVEEELGGASA